MKSEQTKQLEKQLEASRKHDDLIAWAKETFMAFSEEQRSALSEVAADWELERLAR